MSKPTPGDRRSPQPSPRPRRRFGGLWPWSDRAASSCCLPQTDRSMLALDRQGQQGKAGALSPLSPETSTVGFHTFCRLGVSLSSGKPHVFAEPDFGDMAPIEAKGQKLNCSKTLWLISRERF